MIPILDPGHGGVINGVYYCRAGGRKVITPEFHYYEGESNRAIVNRIAERLAIKNVPFHILVTELEDPPLSLRVSRANNIYFHDPETYLISFHSNAGGGTGFEIWTSPGQTESDAIAEEFAAALTAHQILGKFKFRADQTDGDRDKEALYTILKDTKCPAILVENLFFDNPEDLKYLLLPGFRETLAECYANKIIELYDKSQNHN